MSHSIRHLKSCLLLLAILLGGCCRLPRVDPAGDYREQIHGTDVAFEMVWIPEGGFWIGRTEVTWDEYLQYCDFEETGAVPPGADAVSKPSKPLEDIAPYDRDWGAGRRPAVGMSWAAAKKYCRWLSLNTGRKFRLPTESEWELACGGGSPEPLGEYAWYQGNSGNMTQETASLKPNERGLHDMLGNLWEYCDNPFDPAQPDRAVLRGGSWKDKAEMVRPTGRLGFDDDWILPDPHIPAGVWWVPEGEHLGFRVICVKAKGAR